MGIRRAGYTLRLFVFALVLGPTGSDLMADEPAAQAEVSSPKSDGPSTTVQPARRSAPAADPTGAEREAARPQLERKPRSSWLRDFIVRRTARAERRESRAQTERADQAPPSPTQSSNVSIPPAIFQPGAPGYPELSGLRLPSPGPSGGAAEPAAAPVPSAPPALTPLYLNRALQLDDSPVRVYGFIENSFNGNTNGLPRNRENFSIYPDHLSDQWMGNQYYLVLEDVLEQSDVFNVGFRVDFLFGNDWLVTKAYGLFDNAFPINHFPGIDFPQLYAEAHLPILTPGGIDLRAGRFYSLTGFESPPAVARPLMSMAYSLPYTPFTFFGAIGSVHLSDRLNFVAGTIDGYDRWPNKPYKWGLISALTWTSRDQKLNVVLGGADAYDQLPRFPPANATYVPDGIPPPPFLAGRLNPFYNHAGRGYVVGVLTYKWNDKLTEAVQTDHIFDQMTLGFSPTPYIPKGAAYHLFAHWFLYQFTERVTGIWRTEILWDPYGLATGNADTLHEMTLGLNIRPKPWLWVRPEARYDWAQFTHPYNDGTRNSQFTLGFDVIVLF
ncbi:MAG TPA: outer membrane beta-barrel protein [Isosphaeraceae bacterium]|nr:outer membrane beta-barrel protein [Isosphaeraceae bacterium]